MRGALLRLLPSGLWLGIVSLGLGLFVWVWGPRDQISVEWAAISCAVLLVVIGVLAVELEAAWRAVKYAEENALPRLPRILRCLSREQTGREDGVILVEPSRLFGHGLSASIYTTHEGYEVWIGEGFLESVNGHDGKLQIVITAIEQGQREIWQKLIANSPDALLKTFVRPGGRVRKAQ